MNPIDPLSAYIPLDRRRALAANHPLTEKVWGAAIFADIDGFTALTEHLVGELGSQRGAEELTVHLNRVYDAVIDVLHEYGASAIAFAGDAVTSWIEADDGRRATACALAMRSTMESFAAVETPGGSRLSLSIKVVIAAGSARRFQVGDPDIRLLDALAGRTLARLAAAETFAGAGEIILEGRTAAGLNGVVELIEKRTDPALGFSCGVVDSVRIVDETTPISTAWPPLSVEQVRPWLHRPVYTRLQSGLGDFLAELRPTVALFVRFSGIDYDEDDDAGRKLDLYIRWVQQVAARFEGTLIDLNIGDKGSYLYINFGALLAHEDSSARALAAALELRRGSDDLTFIEPVQIGISRGRMRVGAYGGSAHRTYGALGAEVNMAARLMMAAEPGQVLVSHTVRHREDGRFIFRLEPPLRLKGRDEAVTAYSLMDVQPVRGLNMVSGEEIGPMVGRRSEIERVEVVLDTALDGHGQIVGIKGEAGVGKSRLMAELLRLAGERHFTVVGSECQSYGVNSTYLVWRSIWHALLRVDANLSADRKARAIRSRLAAIDTGLELRYPLLGALLDIDIPDNELTAALDAKTRKAALESLLIDCLAFEAKRRPLVILLEDCHWLDPLSQDLIDAVSEAIVDWPVVLVMAFRPPEMERLERTLGAQQPHYSELELSVLDADETEAYVDVVLEQLYGRHMDASGALVDAILDQADGNPLYVVELLSYMCDQGIDPESVDDVEGVALPDSLHTLVLSRVDRLPEHATSVLKVASVLGRFFHANWLSEVSGSLGNQDDVHRSLAALVEQELVALDPAATDTSHFFRQSIVQSAIYDSLPHNLRSRTHEAAGIYIEEAQADRLDSFLNLLAYHFERSDNLEKQVDYLRKAGIKAQADYANEAAIEYFERLVPHLAPAESVDVHVRLGQVLQLVGRWDQARSRYLDALETANALDDLVGVARCHRALGRLLYHEQPQQALQWLEQGLALSRSEGLTGAEVAEPVFLIDIGWAQFQLANFDRALETLRCGLEMLPSEPGEIRGNALSSLTAIHINRGDVEAAMRYAEEALANGRAIPNLWQEQIALSNLAVAHFMALDWRGAVSNLQEAIALAEMVGDKRVQAGQAVNMGLTYLNLGQSQLADQYLRTGIRLARESHLREYELLAQRALAELNIRTGDLETAREMLQATMELADVLDDSDSPAKIERIWAELCLAGNDTQEALVHATAAIDLAEKNELYADVAIGKRVLGQALLSDGQLDAARSVMAESVAALREHYVHEGARSQFHLGRVKMAAGDTVEGTRLVGEARDVFQRLDAGFDLADVEQYSKQNCR
jgi:adenylate cyclase